MSLYVLNLAKKRKSVRKFSKENIPIKKVLKALETATQAPSGANQQPWRFIVITEKDVKIRIKNACEKGEREFYKKVDGEFKQWLREKKLSWKKPFLENAPVLVSVLMKKDAQYALESVWIAIGFILLALEEQGLGALTYTPSNTEYPLRELNVPEEYQLEVIIPIGTSKDNTLKQPKMSLKDIVYLNQWGTAITAEFISRGVF
jgi:nitroreductase